MASLQEMFAIRQAESSAIVANADQQPVDTTITATAPKFPIELELEPWEYEILDETEFPPCPQCGSHDVWLPVASRDIASPDPTWQCRKCDRKPNTSAQNRIDRVRQRWRK